MSITTSLEISASGLSAQRLRLDVISNNLANVNTTRVAGRPGTPFRRQEVVFSSEPGAGGFQDALNAAGAPAPGGVRASVQDDETPFKKVRDPGNPDADADGYVLMPNVEPVKEMVDMMMATRSYEAGVTALDAAKQLQLRALDIGKG